jgi:hypothetical protein
MRALSAVLLFSASLFLLASVQAQDTKTNDAMQNCPMHAQHATADSHHAIVEQHGDQAMGFAHDKTTHHFRLAPDGGTIEVTANDVNDKTSTDQIRSHLLHIALAFANGDFSTPMFVHDGLPPGVTTMQLLKAAIHYQYQEIASGGRVRITSSDKVAIAAVHDFLRFQITEHQTGDPLEVKTKH